MMFIVVWAGATAGRSAVMGDRPREQVQPGRGVVDPSQVSLQSVERMVSQEHAEKILVPFQFGELAHPLQVRRPLGVQVVVGRTVEHQGEYHLGEQLTLQVRLGRDRLGQPPLHIRDARLSDDVPPAFGPGPLLDRPGHRFSVPGQPGQGCVHLAVAQRPALAEVRVVVPFQVIPVAWPPLEQAKKSQRNTHN